MQLECNGTLQFRKIKIEEKIHSCHFASAKFHGRYVVSATTMVVRNAVFVATVALALPGVASFVRSPRSASNLRPRASPLTVVRNAPEYTKVDGVLTEAEEVGRGSVMLHCNGPNDYKPGHVFALELDDAQEDGSVLKGPYTVSRATPDSFDVLIKGACMVHGRSAQRAVGAVDCFAKVARPPPPPASAARQTCRCL